MTVFVVDGGKQIQIPPLRCGMTTRKSYGMTTRKSYGMTTKKKLRNDNKEKATE
jgi:hypothetical protein